MARSGGWGACPQTALNRTVRGLPTRPVCVLDDDDTVVRPFAAAGARVVARDALLDSFRTADVRTRWVTSRWDIIAPLAVLAPKARPAYGLLVIDRFARPEPVLQEALRPHFARFVAPSRSTALLEAGQAAEVITSREPGDYLLAAQVVGDRLFLARGSFDMLTVPLRSFRPAASGLAPDFERVTIVDHGLAIALGEYESTAEVILYEHDKGYRRRAKQRERAHDDSFGAALRRLRLLRGLRRSDFAPIDERELRRLEANEIKRPPGAIRRILAQRLGV